MLAKLSSIFYFAGRIALLGAIAAALAFFAAPPIARADVEKRVALVIGNGDYKSAPRLDNPPIDARAVAASLKRLGFQVVEGYDLNVAQMRTTLAEFSAALPDAKSALVYYAGHGVSVDEENYLLPTDIVLKSPTDLDFGAIGISLVLKQMKREDRVNIVILDACRDNPFASEMARNKTRAAIGERGLSPVEGELARGTLIAFASNPKSTALDGRPGEHSPFTAALVGHLEDPGVPIDTVMSRVRAEVYEATKHAQLPWVNTSIIGEYVLNPQTAPVAVADLGATAAAKPAPASAGDRQAQENLLWQSAQHSGLAADYKAYLDAYPSGVFAQMARNRIAKAADAQAPSTDRVLARPASLAPAAVSPPAYKSEISSFDTEKALNLSASGRKEVQQRLSVLESYKGQATGVFDDTTRAALSDWQKKHDLTPTGWLGPLQLAQLRIESESSYQRLLAAQQMVPVTMRATPAPPPRKPAPIVARKHKVRPLYEAPAQAAAAPPPPSPTPYQTPTMPTFDTGFGAGLLFHRFRH